MTSLICPLPLAGVRQSTPIPHIHTSMVFPWPQNPTLRMMPTPIETTKVDLTTGASALIRIPTDKRPNSNHLKLISIPFIHPRLCTASHIRSTPRVSRLTLHPVQSHHTHRLRSTVHTIQSPHILRILPHCVTYPHLPRRRTPPGTLAPVLAPPRPDLLPPCHHIHHPSFLPALCLILPLAHHPVFMLGLCPLLRLILHPILHLSLHHIPPP